MREGGPSLWSLLAALGLVLLNGLLVAAEFSIVQVRRARIEALAAQGHRPARAVLYALDHLDSYLSATQIGITVAALGLGSLGENAVSRLILLIPHRSLGSRAVLPAHVLAFLAITFCVIAFGELFPKALAIQHAERVALATAPFVRTLARFFSVPIGILSWGSRLLLRAFHLQLVVGRELAHSEDELRQIVAASTRRGVLKPAERDLIEHVFEMGDKTVSQVMVPRVDMVAVSTQDSVPEALKKTEAAGHTRYPLCENGDPDQVIGFVHVKDILRIAGEAGAGVRSICRPILRVPEAKGIDQMLREFQRNRAHIAVVLDEYGGTAGILTLEDVLEELVGEMGDEFERRTPGIQRLAEGRYLVDGGTALEDLADALNVRVDAPGIDTVGGFVQATIGATPRRGAEVALDGYRMEVVEMTRRRVRRVLVERDRNQ